MYERFIFATEVEREGTRELVSSNFPTAIIWNVKDEDSEDFLMDMQCPVDKCLFFRWAISTHGPSRLMIYSCYTMSLQLCQPPDWMLVEINLRYKRLTDGR